MSTFEKKQLTKKTTNLSEWYLDVVNKAQLADYSDVKGSMIIRPNGYALWEMFQSVLDSWFKQDGVRNTAFPMLIPYEYLKREKEHLEGFSPELALVTHAGGEDLAEPLVIRPTSETIMYKTFAKWIQSYRDLPLKINQWCSVMRWEKRTFPFIRTSEFLWQEGHTAHQKEDEADGMARLALEWYRKFYEEYLGISVYLGIKSESEKFAGAKRTYSIELVMPDGKALQAATAHNLSDNFAKVFDVTYLDQKGAAQHVRQTSWGLSTRSIGGLIMTHGDDAGLVLPPHIAPTQVVIVLVGRSDDPTVAKLIPQAEDIAVRLGQAGFRVHVDTNFQHTLGYRINDWEVQGVPLRLEFGQKEQAEGKVSFARRDTFEKGSIVLNDLASRVGEILGEIQTTLFTRTQELKDSLTTEADSFEEFEQVMKEGKKFIRAFWCEDPACEREIKEKTKATTRVLELDLVEQNKKAHCVHCAKKAHRRWLFAQSY